jgi:hypothetical protein
MTMWLPHGSSEEDVSNLAGNDPERKRRRSRRRSWRDGLADQTVIRNLEDVRADRAFEHTLIGSIDPRSVIELALVHRLANLLWRLRRAGAIETGLFEMQGELLSARRQDPPPRTQSHSKGPNSNGRDNLPISDHDNSPSTTMRAAPGRWSKSRAIAQCFLRLSNLNPALLDRVGRYEARLWRQAARTLRTFDAMRRPQLALIDWPERANKACAAGFNINIDAITKAAGCSRHTSRGSH